MDGAVMALTIVAAYDVREDDRRSRLAALLQIHGDRIQKSVFLLTLDDKELAELKQRCLSVIDPDTDSLWFIRQCVDCWNDAVRLGQSDLRPAALYWAAL